MRRLDEEEFRVLDKVADRARQDVRRRNVVGIEDVLLNAPVTQAAVHAVEDEAARVEEAGKVAAERAQDRAAARDMVDEGAPVVAGEGIAPPQAPAEP